MPRDNITELLLKVSRGEVSVEDAKTALSDVELTEDQLEKAIDHGVFNTAEPGTVISAKLAPSGGSYLAIFFFGWGIFWVFYWSFTMLYGLFNKWDQQQLSFHLAMTLTVLIMMGVVYMRFILPDKVIVKHRANKYIPKHQKDWRDYKI
tara:strand:- start:173 stop:619 length:447 start_codon:yes stop_codon:yes gene_type:complete